MAIQFTLQRFPVSGSLKEECGLPFACVVQPFAKDNNLLDTTPSTKLEDLGRCAECYSYVNYYCGFQPAGWSCSLCGGWNEYNSLRNKRYARPSYRATCSELRKGLVEVLCNISDGSLQDGELEAEPVTELPAQPIYLALVDVACSEEFLELVKSALLAALEAIPPAALFGLVTFSRKVGLYDLQGAAPVALHVALLASSEEDAPTALDLADALPLEALLAPVATCKDTISAALEGLEPDASLEGSGRAARSRGFGSALQAVLRYLSGAGSAAQDSARRRSNGKTSTSGRAANEASTLAYAGARMLTFLSGPPNFARGSVVRPHQPQAPPVQYETPVYFDPSFPDVTAYTYSAPAPPAMSKEQATVESGFSLDADPDLANGSAAQEELDPEAQSFYEEAAAAASLLGVCVDVYAASAEAVGLQFIAPLASSSGGAVYLYPALDQAALPQDMYRRLSCPFALGGLLRLRTSPEYRAARAYGQLFQDDQFDNLAHVISCDPHTTFAFDFEFANAAGFSDIGESPPMLQMVFQYSALLPAGAQQKAAAEAREPVRYVLQRRMRILTLALPVARPAQAVFEAVGADAVLCVLMHKIVRACEEEGEEEGRALLQDWLVILTANFNRLMYRQRHRTPAQVDVAFEEVKAMQPLARLVYALLRSPLLSGHAMQHPDMRAAALHLWAALPADELRRAVYPILSSFTDPETQAFPRHSLSRAALITSGAPLFLMDTFTSLTLYYTAGYPAHIPFPPPQQSLLRRTINTLRQNRRLTPQLRMLRGGFDDVSVFTEALIEEPDASGPPGSLAALGFVGFLEQIREAVWKYMQENE
ncbi:hypothetical protein WJX72_002854 [[Myrmecia] bisecta]|uniref:Uncharacterized protein n=1 Tax=[Myrmecia] bisecta TaxID=41462 RepID=A0AAW1QPN2_9CHLO